MDSQVSFKPRPKAICHRTNQVCLSRLITVGNPEVQTLNHAAVSSVSCSNWNQDAITCSLWGNSEETGSSQQSCQGFALMWCWCGRLDHFLKWCSFDQHRDRGEVDSSVSRSHPKLVIQQQHRWRCSGVEQLAFYFDVLLKAFCGNITLSSTINWWFVAARCILLSSTL